MNGVDDRGLRRGQVQPDNEGSELRNLRLRFPETTLPLRVRSRKMEVAAEDPENHGQEDSGC
jgi:hypothetical protein